MKLNYNDSESSVQLQALASRVLIDVGYITTLDKDHKATVILHGDHRILKGVDCIYPCGLGEGGEINQDCLVFIPKTEYHSESGVNHASPDFSLSGAKALPISLGKQDRVAIYGNDMSELSIASEAFSLLFSSQNISLINNYTKVYIDEGGNISLSLNEGLIILSISSELQRITYFNSVKIPYYQKEYNIAEGIITEYWAGLSEVTDEQYGDMSLYEDWTRSKTYNNDGTTSETINEETFITSTYTNNAVSLTINGEDNSIILNTENCQINVDTDGNISITNSGTLSISTSGDTEISTEGAMTLTTGNGTLGAMISEMCDDINAIVTVGSPATHTIDPSSQSTFQSFVQTWGEYFK